MKVFCLKCYKDLTKLCLYILKAILNKTGLQPVSRPVEQFFFSKRFKKVQKNCAKIYFLKDLKNNGALGATKPLATG